MLLAVICACIAVTGVIYSLLNRSASETERRLASVGASQTRTVRQIEERDSRPPRGDVLRTKLRQVMPSRLRDRLAVTLMAAGIRATPETVLLFWGMAAAGLPGGYLLLASRNPNGLGRTQYILLGALALMGFYVPLTLIRGRVRKRRGKLSRALPDAMDLLTTCVEAGLGIDAAFARVAEKAKEPLGEEIRMMLRGMAMGSTRREMLEQFAERNAIPEIRSFATAVIQAEMMGVSLGHVLRVQTEALRVQRRQKAEQQAQKAPVKIIIVLALFIFPAMFVVILGPAVMQFMQNAVL